MPAATATDSEPVSHVLPPKPGGLQRLGLWCARHFVIVIALWALGLGGLHLLQNSVGGSYSDEFSLPGTQSNTGQELIRDNAPTLGTNSATVVLHTPGVPLSAVSAQITVSAAALQQLPHVVTVVSPLGAPTTQTGTPQPTPGALSADGTIGYFTVRFDANPAAFDASYLDDVDSSVESLRAAGVQVEYGGPLGELARPATTDMASEAIGFGVAVIVLLVGFGSLLAAGLPLLTALISVVVGLSGLSLLAAVFTFASVSPTLATMIGLGVGIDYALFLITRHRQLVMDGVAPADAAGQAVATSGRAVVVSGCTVIVALAGLYVSQISFIGKLGAAAAVTVVTAVLGAVTLVPAFLGLIRNRIDRYHLGAPIAEGTSATAGSPAEAGQGFWHRYAQCVQRRPWQFLACGAAVIALLAVPLVSMRLGHVDNGSDPTSFTDRRAFDLISTGFGPGVNGPLTIVVDQSAVSETDRPALAANLRKALTAVPGAASITPLQPSGNGKILFGTAIPAERPQNAASTDLFNRLKTDVLPQATSGTPAQTYLTGNTASQVDFLELISDRLPLIIATVVALAFLIIVLVFRGLLVALKAAVLNLLSIAASYGIVVAVFQWGWGSSLLGVEGTVPIESYVPMMMFAIVFGLSMDYEIFLLSRVHEAWERTKDSGASVAHGLEVTARVITCAALIMVSVFAAFILSDSIVIKMLGLGLAVSVLIDATIVRLLLVPAVMTLLGRHAWRLPEWLDRVLPRIDAEGTNANTPQPAA
ncbi:MMPL family transporter (plasmid) [Kitasatospora sp. NBC_00070]|uniref:MMPL family transporter n=1 Tax=Kitasatospora sp. NBC_00070 TaxID=2975962 RepID=UPI002F90802E